MSEQWPGGYLTKTPVTPTPTAAPGVWNLSQQAAYQQAGTWPYGGPFTYIEDVFSTYIYTGNGSTQTITNNIDLSGKGGLCWFKIRDSGTYDHAWVDTARGRAYTIASDLSNAQFTSLANYDLASFNSDGFTVGPTDQFSAYNRNGSTIVSWTFRKQPKFFDVVTYSGNGTAGRTISHSLGSVPGFIVVKNLTNAGSWRVYHRMLNGGVNPANYYTDLNSTTVATANSAYWNNTAPTSTVFTVGSHPSVNDTGANYVAYIFAHDAGGFGLTNTDNVISCGSYTGNGSATGPTVTLGYEPQWIMIKRTDVANGWIIHDVMRGLPTGGNSIYLQANTNDAEAGPANYVDVNATGFQLKTTGNAWNASGGTYIYIAIRRGPMKIPTDATKVFSPIANSASTGTVNTTGFPVDMGIVRWRDGVDNNYTRSRLQGVSSTTTEGGSWFSTNSTAAEVSTGGITRLWNNTGFQTTSGFDGYSTVYWNFGRAPSFFDEVCYTGNVTARTINHNLAAVPELIIVKNRGSVSNWAVYSAATGNGNYLGLNTATGQTASTTYWNSTTPTSSVFSLGTSTVVNASGNNYVAYLFATCPGVSKVGSYTGTGTTQQINCGFAAGARFVLIKRTDSTGDWYVWDSARGIVAGNDPYLLLNSTAAEVTSTDYVDTYSAGFEISSTAPAAINASGGTFIFLAIA